MAGPPEQDLVDRLHAGDPVAWQTLYDAHAAGVWRFVARLLGPRAADIADVVQETFLSAARGVRQFDPARGTLWLWLCGIARRQAALQFRRQGRDQRLKVACARLLEDAGDSIPAPATDRNTLLPNSPEELAELVRATLLELPEGYGALLAARYLDAEDIAQLAQRHGCSNQALRARLTRARVAFRDAFSRHLEQPAELSR